MEKRFKYVRDKIHAIKIAVVELEVALTNFEGAERRDEERLDLMSGDSFEVNQDLDDLTGFSGLNRLN